MLISGHFIAADRHRVYYDYYKNGNDRLIIIAHGFFNSKQALLLKELGESLAREFDVILFDFRGHGESKGFFHWTTKEYLDLLAVIDYAKEHYKKIGVIGFSLGAATSIITATKTDLINSLIAVSAPTDFGKIDYQFWKFDVENDLIYGLIGKGLTGKGARPGPFWQKKEKPLDIVPSIKVPILYIHGDSDWIIHHRHSEELYKKTASTKRLHIVKQGPHAEYLLRKNREEMLELIRDWFQNTL